MILYAAHNVLKAEESAEGYLLLQMIRSYLELDMFSSLTVQTDSIIQSGERELKTFGQLIKVCILHSD